jgi:hypothetical protein
MVEKPQTDKKANDAPTFTPDLPIGPSSESEEHIRVLLEAYQETLKVAEDLPAIVWIPLRGEGLRRYIKMPHLRYFLRYFLSDHIRRGLGLLKRQFHASAALTGESEANQANINGVEHYLQALPPPPYKRLAIAVLFAVLVLTLPLRQLGDVTPILGFVMYVVTLNAQGVTVVVNTTGFLEALSGTLVLLGALFIVGSLPTSTFVLKRLLFNLYPGAKERLSSVAGRDHVFSVEGLYTLEDRTFGECGIRRPKEFPYDLLVRILVLSLVLLPLIFTLGFLPFLLSAGRRFTEICALLTILLFTYFVVRLRRLLIAWRKRNGPSGLPPADHRDSPLYRAYALARERLEQGTQTIDPFPPLRTKKSPRLAFVLGFLFNGVGLGIYFRSWVDLIVPIIASSAWLMLIGALHYSGRWIGVLLIGGLWGLLRTVSSNKRLGAGEGGAAAPV